MDTKKIEDRVERKKLKRASAAETTTQAEADRASRLPKRKMKKMVRGQRKR